MRVSHGVHEFGAWGSGISLTILVVALLYTGFKNLPPHHKKSVLRCIPVLLVIGLAGYWFIARPYYARKNCNKFALHYISQNYAGEEGYTLANDVCLNSKGV
jgi:hypothetical protein